MGQAPSLRRHPRPPLSLASLPLGALRSSQSWLQTDITKLILGIAAGSIVLLVGSSNLVQQSGGRSLKSFASPMFMVAMSIVYGVLFMTLLVLNYEHHRYNPSSNSYTRFKYTRNQALGFSALACFCIGYAWLVVAATR